MLVPLEHTQLSSLGSKRSETEQEKHRPVCRRLKISRRLSHRQVTPPLLPWGPSSVTMAVLSPRVPEWTHRLLQCLFLLLKGRCCSVQLEQTYTNTCRHKPGTCRYMHTHAQTDTHSHRDTQTHTHRATDTHSHRDTQTHSHRNTQTHTGTYRHTHRDTQTHTAIGTHRHTLTGTHRHTQGHTDTHTGTHRHTQP